MRAAANSRVSPSSFAGVCDTGVVAANRRNMAIPTNVPMTPKKTTARLNVRSLRPDRFHLDMQRHLHFETIPLANRNAEVSTVEDAKRVRAAQLLLGFGLIVDTFKGIDDQRNGFGDAVKGQQTSDRRWRSVYEIAQRAPVRGSWIFLSFEDWGRRRVHRHIA